MLNHYLEKEQENRAVATLSQSIEQPELPAEQYSGGWFDGLIGEKPRYPKLKLYSPWLPTSTARILCDTCRY